MIAALLILHGLVGVALLGALTHQAATLLRQRTVRTGSFIDRYMGVNQRAFVGAVVVLYAAEVLLGAIIYPTYRIDVRIPFEEMSMGWAVGVFELKEHFAGIGLGVLPLYAVACRADSAATEHRARLGLTLVLAFVVWWGFLIGHVLNNIRGLA